jgi:aerobic carbon-monoxide dehydrogenase small subunit
MRRPVTNTSEGFDLVPIEVRVNGKLYERTVPPRMLLVELIREELDLCGTHIGCDTTYCGACTVLLNGGAVKSCTMFAFQAHQGEITTVEGLANGEELHPIQKAFAENHGLQCGYCTPGFLMSTMQLLTRIPNPTEKQIRKAIAGNTCRCTGYQNILKSIRAAVKATVDAPAGKNPVPQGKAE